MMVREPNSKAYRDFKYRTLIMLEQTPDKWFTIQQLMKYSDVEYSCTSKYLNIMTDCGYLDRTRAYHMDGWRNMYRFKWRDVD